MATKKPKAAKPRTAEELQKELLDLRREQFNLRMQKGAGQLTKTHQVRSVRRDIARAKHQIADLTGKNASRADKPQAESQ